MSGQFLGLLETGQCHSYSEWSTVFLCSNYRPVSMTSVLSKVFEPLVSVRRVPFMERSGVLPTKQFAYWNGLGTCDALLCVSHTLQEGRIVQIEINRQFSISSVL